MATRDKGQKNATQAEDDLLDWFTISYRTIYVAVGLAAVVARRRLGGYYYCTRSGPPPPRPSRPVAAATTARFTSIEGSVKVKTVGTFEWVTADKSMVLRKSDLVRTGSGRGGGDPLLRRHGGARAPRQPDHDRGDLRGPVDQGAQGGLAHLLGRGELPDRPQERARQRDRGLDAQPSRGTVGEMSAGATPRRRERRQRHPALPGRRVESRPRPARRIELGASEAVKVDAAGKAGPKVAAARRSPLLLAPPHQAEITYPDPTRATTLLAWKPVAGRRRAIT